MESANEKTCRCEHCSCQETDTRLQDAKTESVWVATAEQPTFAPLRTNETCDVLVIGAGITGLTAAADLARAGKKVIVVEAARIGQGVTGYTTAHLTSIIDTRFRDLIQRFGQEKTKQLVGTTEGSIAKVAENIKAHQIDCDFAYVPGYLYTEDSADAKELREEAEAAQQLGLAATYTDDIPLPFTTRGGVQFDQQAQFHPLKYCAGLARAITHAGGKIFEETRVTDVVRGKPWQVTTSSGSLEAEAVFMATHTPITKMLSVQSKLAAFRSYVIGVRLNAGQVPGLFWDTMHPYHYLRTYKTDQGDMVIIGGEDHRTGEKVGEAFAYEALQEYTCERFNVASFAYRWSAQVFEPVDGLPYIGKAPAKVGLYVATGYAGNGMTFGTVAAQLVTDLILDRPNPAAHMYAPGRITLAALKRLTEYGISNAKHYMLDRLRRAPATPLDEIRPGNGQIVRVDGKNLAVYRDTQGVLTKLSPVCTHAGCIVEWNGAEKTWDCPCHGGRYTPLGKVINGPPVKDLARAE